MTALAALIWIFFCAVAGAFPNRWHRRIAYTLMAVAVPILWALWTVHGWPWALGFFFMTLVQFRLLLLHWLRRGVAHLARARGQDQPEKGGQPE